jgi:hypothetical protein
MAKLSVDAQFAFLKLNLKKIVHEAVAAVDAVAEAAVTVVAAVDAVAEAADTAVAAVDAATAAETTNFQILQN